MVIHSYCCASFFFSSVFVVDLLSFFVLFFRYSWVSVVRRTGACALFTVFRFSTRNQNRTDFTINSERRRIFDIRSHLCQKYQCLYVEKHLIFSAHVKKLSFRTFWLCFKRICYNAIFILYYLSHLYLSCRSTNEQISIGSCWFQAGGTAEWIYCNLFKPRRLRRALKSTPSHVLRCKKTNFLLSVFVLFSSANI